LGRRVLTDSPSTSGSIKSEGTTGPDGLTAPPASGNLDPVEDDDVVAVDRAGLHNRQSTEGTKHAADGSFLEGAESLGSLPHASAPVVAPT